MLYIVENVVESLLITHFLAGKEGVDKRGYYQ
jgi:hypothetical protein